MLRREFLGASGVAALGLVLPKGVVKKVTAPTLPAGLTRRTIPAGYASAGRTYIYRNGSATEHIYFGFHGAAHDWSNLNDTWWTGGATEGWHSHAATYNYSLLFGEGVGGRWNVGGGWPGGTQNDDQYALDCLDDWQESCGGVGVGLVGGGVWACGFSNGGAMAWRLAALHPEVFAGAIEASGWASVYPELPIDAWHIHGTADTVVPVRGGVGVYGVSFPEAALEATKAPRGSRVVLYPTNGGHGTPGWMADRMRWAVNMFLAS